MKRDYPLAPTPDPKFITAKRAYEVADSLDREAFNKFNAARIRVKGESKAEGDKLSDELNKSRMQDKSNASRYRALADKALKKKK
jgi:hypothetical protein